MGCVPILPLGLSPLPCDHLKIARHPPQPWHADGTRINTSSTIRATTATGKILADLILHGTTDKSTGNSPTSAALRRKVA